MHFNFLSKQVELFKMRLLKTMIYATACLLFLLCTSAVDKAKAQFLQVGVSPQYGFITKSTFDSLKANQFEVTLISVSGTCQTVGATSCDIITIPTTTNVGYLFRTYMSESASDGIGGIDVIVSTRTKKVKNSNGVVVVTSLVNTTSNDAGLSLSTIDLISSGTNIILRGTGQVGETINWNGIVSYIKQ